MMSHHASNFLADDGAMGTVAADEIWKGRNWKVLANQATG
jgi:hypothetical protein